MGILAIKAIFMIALPTVVFFGGAWIMSEMSDRERVMERLSQAAAPADQKPLNQRLCYDVAAVHRHWGALDDTARHAERRFLELDLIFPFLYGVALATSLLMAWASLGRPFNPAWVLAPVVITLLADWTENLVQLGQIKRYIITSNETALQAGWIQVASTATMLKLLLFGGVSLLLLWLVALVLIRALRSP